MHPLNFNNIHTLEVLGGQWRKSNLQRLSALIPERMILEPDAAIRISCVSGGYLSHQTRQNAAQPLLWAINCQTKYAKYAADNGQVAC